MNKTDNTPTLDKSVRPQDDFFGYVNNNWLAANPIPPSESRWGTFNVLRDQAWQAMKQLYEELTHNKNLEKGSIEQQARDFYYTGTHSDELTKTHLNDVRVQLQKIEAINDLTSLSQCIGELQAIGISGPWRVIVDLDEKDSTAHIFRLHQGELTLPDRDYYLENTEKMKAVRAAYKAHLEKLHEFFPELAADPELFSKTILAFETDLAKKSRSQTALRDVEANYNKTSYTVLRKTYPTIDWPAFAKATGWQPSDQISVDQPEFLSYVNKQFSERSLDDWKIYLKWQFLQLYYDKISEEFAARKFDFFGKVLSGTTELLPQWKRVTSVIDSAMGEGVGRLYVQQHFSESSKQQVLDMVENIRAVYKKRIENLDWMSAPTKKAALKKLANIKVLIGYPDAWRDFSGMHIDRTSYIQNIIASQRFSNEYWLHKLGQPTSRDEWLMSPQTVNAYHDPNRLVICFPAAILQAPFFDPTADRAANLGGIGSVIGHEFTHGFDDQGCQFDEQGNVRMWQTLSDRKAFDQRAQIVIDQADSFEVLPGLTLKGKLVIGESIADLGGIELAFDALEVKDLEQAKRFFISFATTECGHTREEKLREFTLSDPHPNEHFRVNAILQHVDGFYTAFDLHETDKLYRKPGGRAKIW